MKAKMKIKFLKDRKPFLKGDVVECTEDHAKGLLNSGEKDSCTEADEKDEVTPRDTLIRRAEDRKAKEIARLKKAAEKKAKDN